MAGITELGQLSKIQKAQKLARQSGKLAEVMDVPKAEMHVGPSLRTPPDPTDLVDIMRKSRQAAGYRNAEAVKDYEYYKQVHADLLAELEQIRRSKAHSEAVDTSYMETKLKKYELGMSLAKDKIITAMSQAELSAIHNPANANFLRTNPKRAQAFKEWFGDGVLKDQKGNPLIFVRGRVSKDKTSQLMGLDEDMFLSSVYPKEIGTHAGSIKAAEQFVAGWQAAGYHAEMVPLIYNFKRPLVMRDQGVWSPAKLANELVEIHQRYPHIFDQEKLDAAVSKLYKAIRPVEPLSDSKFTSELHKKVVVPFLEDAGFDGIVYLNSAEDAGHMSAIAFHPEQIKSPWALGFDKNKAGYMQGALAAPLGTLASPKENEAKTPPKEIEEAAKPAPEDLTEIPMDGSYDVKVPSAAEDRPGFGAAQ